MSLWRTHVRLIPTRRRMARYLLRTPRLSSQSSIDPLLCARPFHFRPLPRSFPSNPVSCTLDGLFHIDSTDGTADIIPTPNLGAGPSSSNLAELVPHNDFDILNKEAANPASTSRRLEQSLEHVQNLLNPTRLIEMSDCPYILSDAHPLTVVQQLQNRCEDDAISGVRDQPRFEPIAVFQDGARQNIGFLSIPDPSLSSWRFDQRGTYPKTRCTTEAKPRQVGRCAHKG